MENACFTCRRKCFDETFQCVKSNCANECPPELQPNCFPNNCLVDNCLAYKGEEGE